MSVLGQCLAIGKMISLNRSGERNSGKPVEEGELWDSIL